MNVGAAKKEIERFFKRHGATIKRSSIPSAKGKVYELYCLAKTIDRLKGDYGLSVRFIGTTLDFKASPGMIDRSKSYFELRCGRSLFELHTDIEITTLGSAGTPVHPDRSEYHEIDIVVVSANSHGRPSYDQLAVGVECKAHAKFSKSILKQVLGVRRELSLLRSDEPTVLARTSGHRIRTVPAHPASEYWLAFTDPDGSLYAASPATFGIEFLHWCP